MKLTRNMPAHTRDRRKWAVLSALPERDAQSDEIKAIAEGLKAAAMGNRRRFVALVHALARDGVAYASDTARVGVEDISGYTRPYTSPLEVLERGADDCDAKARLCVSTLLAGGVAARMADWWNPETGDLQHVAAEYLDDGRWVHLETILSRARVGDVPDQVPTEADGRWKYS